MPKSSAGIMAPGITWEKFLSLPVFFFNSFIIFSMFVKCKVASKCLRDDLRMNDKKGQVWAARRGGSSCRHLWV